ncbi:hypothetical protein ACIO6T_14585 [Streptomyces sp. NPDC087532]|uniref:hypothetical protein n=1 Tax=Streptomyces sp. NPDC087532 TaxID=3365795 RepID=UPI0037F352A0
MTTPNALDRLRGIASMAPADLSIWETGRSALPSVLFEVSRRRLTDKFQRFKAGGPLADGGEIGGKWAFVVANLVEWAFIYDDQTSEGREATEQDIVAAVDLAISWKSIDIALNAGRAGRAKISHTKRGFWIDPLSDPRIETLDLLLEGIDTLAEPVAEVGPDLEPAIKCLNSLRGDVPGGSSTAPRWVMGLFVQHAKNNLRAQPWEVAGCTDIGGMTLDEAVTLLGTLKGISDLGQEVFARYPSLTMANPAFRRNDLKELIVRYNPSSKGVDRFLEMLTFTGQKGRSPLSAPLIQWGDHLIVTYHLLHDSMAERMLLRAAATDPASSGKLGHSLGRLCGRWGARLSGIPGVQVAEEVKVLDSGNRKLGDLDVVALDVHRMEGLIVEAKWPIDAKTLGDARKQEDAIDKGRAQILRLQTEMLRGDLKVKFPHGWPEFTEVQWTWIVGTARFLDARKIESPIPATSLRLVETLLPVGSLQELIDALERLPLPKEGKDFRLGWKKAKVSGHVFHVRTIEILRPPPTSSPLGRRRADGWT